MHDDPFPDRASLDPVPVGDLIGDVLSRLQEVLGDPVATGLDQPPLAAADGCERSVAHAREVYDDPQTRGSFRRSSCYFSLNPAVDGVSAGISKATVFVGDVLHRAGFSVPSFEVRGWDGCVSREYRHVTTWPRQGACFATVVDAWETRPADVIVVAPRGGDAHAEIVTHVAFVNRSLVITSIGAREHGLEEDCHYGQMVLAAVPEGGGFLHRSPLGNIEARLHVLRPRPR